MKPKIFLADLVHNQHLYRYAVPLNIGYLAATIVQDFGNAVDLKLFKFPDRLLESMNEKPDILGVSNYDWNENLNKAIIQMAKRINPELFVVMGGPNIGSKQGDIQKFLRENPWVDAYVLFEGEKAFAGIVEYFIGHEGRLQDSLVKKSIELGQVAYLNVDEGRLIMGSIYPSTTQRNIPHPSAWLSGLLEPFLNCKSFPLFPIIETTRGCPYKCSFCASGGSAFTGMKTIRQFDLNTILEELNYIFINVKYECVHLAFNDTNMGILKRDMQIIEEVRRLADKHGKVTSVGMSVSKQNVQINLEIYKILGPLATASFAQQTFNKEVLANVNRVNVDPGKINRLVGEVHSNGSKISTDLLVGLPGESKELHLKSLKEAVDYGFDKFQISDIRLLQGTELADDRTVRKYRLKTKYRIIPSAFGVYNGERVIEYEKCIRETIDMLESEFIELRLIHSHIYLMLGFEIGRRLLMLAKAHGLHQIDLIGALCKVPPQGKYPLLAKTISNFLEIAGGEWFDSQELANSHYMQNVHFQKMQKEGFPKLTYQYASGMIKDKALCEEFLRWVSWNIGNSLPEIEQGLIDEIVSFEKKILINYPIDVDGSKQLIMSGKGLKAIGLSPNGQCIDESWQEKKWLVEFVMDKRHHNNIKNMISGLVHSCDDQHAIELILQFHEKVFLRSVKIVRLAS